jgi:hypothetical protein
MVVHFLFTELVANAASPQFRLYRHTVILHFDFLCCILFVVLANKNGGVTVIFINQFTSCFGPDRPPSGA